ncbi:NUDIX domain-containing protein [Corynebacterium lizhenjunii]|uniref:NAD(+) diphosphatase n=1 Tax=Corynebacterium lizhenjunii TaxID=2709394 RepID=A0A7T0KF94_9CORY|nr:NUDIX domain-containing protein [Corynebacterium lizhenjunii]QPK79716.1 NUDIX domain-containing protein [Corynebacterium lizhenjunii]
MFLAVTESGRVQVDAAGQPAWRATAPAQGTGLRVKVAPGRWAVEVAQAPGEFVDASSSPTIAGDRLAARAVGLLRNRRLSRFHPETGEALEYSQGNIVGRASNGREIFPRLDPAVIGVVTHGEHILLGRHSLRPDYYSLPAGYVDVGETLEQAFAREVWEETGRRVDSVRYWGSQPWPSSGSLMLGMWATTQDVEAVGECDGELAQVRWASREEVRHLPLAAPGSIAYRMIMEWLSNDA